MIIKDIRPGFYIMPEHRDIIRRYIAEGLPNSPTVALYLVTAVYEHGFIFTDLLSIHEVPTRHIHFALRHHEEQNLISCPGVQLELSTFLSAHTRPFDDSDNFLPRLGRRIA